MSIQFIKIAAIIVLVAILALDQLIIRDRDWLSDRPLKMFFILMMQPIFLGMVLWNLLGALGILWLLNPNILPHLRSLPPPAFMLLATLTCMSATAQSFALVTIATDLRRKYVTKKR